MSARAAVDAGLIDRRRSPESLLAAVLLVVAAGCGGESAPPASDAGSDATVDAGHDAGQDAGTDAGQDAGQDAGTSVPCSNLPGLYQTGSCSVLAAGVMAYAPRFTLWTDGAEKERFIYLPAGTTIDGTDPDAWVFPMGTTLWKHFSYGGMRVETRMLRKVSNGVGISAWEMRTFQWNDTQDDVTEITLGANNVLGTNHDIPAQVLCQTCHRTKDTVLGFSAIQLAADAQTVGMPLTWLMSSGLLVNLPSGFTAAEAAIPGTPTDVAALGYLHANCGHCHLGVGGVQETGNMRLWVPVGLTTLQQTPTYLYTVGASGAGVPTVGWNPGTLRVAPHSPGTSAVHMRMNVRDSQPYPLALNQMPPLATEQIDTAGLALVDAWINSLP